MNKEFVRNRIKLHREKYSDNQSNLAKKLNVARPSVNAWEIGTHSRPKGGIKTSK